MGGFVFVLIAEPLKVAVYVRLPHRLCVIGDVTTLKALCVNVYPPTDLKS